MTNNLSTAQGFIQEIAEMVGSNQVRPSAGKLLADNYVDRFLSTDENYSQDDGELAAQETFVNTGKLIIQLTLSGELPPSYNTARAAYVLGYAIQFLMNGTSVPADEDTSVKLIRVHDAMDAYLHTLATKLLGGK